jgi:hypothetical protein
VPSYQLSPLSSLQPSHRTASPAQRLSSTSMVHIHQTHVQEYYSKAWEAVLPQLG